MDDVRLIDANALRKTIAEWAVTADNSTSFVDSVEGFAYDEVLDAIDAATTIDPETLRKKAHWKPEDPDSDIWFECSHCGCRISTSWDYDPDDMWTYCPACGAKMEDDT